MDKPTIKIIEKVSPVNESQEPGSSEDEIYS